MTLVANSIEMPSARVYALTWIIGVRVATEQNY